VVQTTSRSEKIFTEEIFGPVVTAYVYKDADLIETLNNVPNGKTCFHNSSGNLKKIHIHFIPDSPYALTGSIFAQDQ